MIRVRGRLHYSIFLLRKTAIMYHTIQNEELFQQARIQHKGTAILQAWSKPATQKVALTTVASIEKYK